MNLRHVAIALPIIWSTSVLACLCPTPPGINAPQKVYDSWAAQFSDSNQVLLDAVVERPEEPYKAAGPIGGLAVLRAIYVWKGPAVTHFRIEYVLSGCPDLQFHIAGEKVRVILSPSDKEGTYFAAFCSQAFLKNPRIIKALAQRLNQPALKPRPLREPPLEPTK